MFFKSLLFLLLVTTALHAKKYTNCTFQNPHYEAICKKVVKRGVSYDYANRFLLDYFKTQKFDEVSWKYLQPRHIKTHKKMEKKANNVLVKHVPKIVKHIKRYKEVYNFVEKEFGVNREIVAAILMKETKLGVIKPQHDAFIVFNTIVTRIKKPQTKREKWLLNMGTSNMAAIITHCYKKKVRPNRCNLPSSYAGAVGIPQFMPNSFYYAKPYRGKNVDLTKMEDAIVSAANFLHKKAKYTELIDYSKLGDVPSIEKEWYNYAHAKKSTTFRKRKSKKNCFTCQKSEYDYLVGYFGKLLKYNNSDNYAIGVLRLAYDTNAKLK